MAAFSGLPELFAIFWAAFAALAGLHVVQPLLAAIAAAFKLEPASAGLLTSAALFPLGIMGLVYGLLFKKRQPKKILPPALLLYALSLAPALLDAGFALLLAARLAQGLILPAILVSLMTYIGQRYQGQTLQRYMSYYAFFVIMGSYLGRLMAGAIAQASGNWRLAWLAPLCLALVAAPSIRFLRELDFQAMPAQEQNDRQLAWRKPLLLLLCITPLLCFVSGAVMNVLPFRLRELDQGISTFRISQIYTCIVACSLMGFIAPALFRLAKSPMTPIIGAIIFYLFLFPWLLGQQLSIFVGAFIGYNFGMALVYVSMPGLLNRIAGGHKYLLNGLYLSLYYMANSAGSYFPLLIYQSLGFERFVWSLFAMASLALIIAISVRKLRL